MKKYGFTLAEVLIALAIIGIAAAVTIPTFSVNSQNQANASKLSVAASSVENAFTAMISSEGADDITETKFGASYSSDDLNEYLKVSSNGSQLSDYYPSGTTYKTIDGDSITPSADYIYETKAGALVMLKLNKVSTTIGDVTYESIGDLTIDANGAAKPNVWGRDLFLFKVGIDGMLYPAGSTTYSKLAYGNTSNVWDSDSGSVPCLNKRSTGCTGRLVAKNYKVDY